MREDDECDCRQCVPEGNGGNVCHHDEQLGHKVDLEQTLAHPRRRIRPYSHYSNENLIQILKEGRNLNDHLREEIIERLRR